MISDSFTVFAATISRLNWISHKLDHKMKWKTQTRNKRVLERRKVFRDFRDHTWSLFHRDTTTDSQISRLLWKMKNTGDLWENSWDEWKVIRSTTVSDHEGKRKQWKIFVFSSPNAKRIFFSHSWNMRKRVRHFVFCKEIVFCVS